MTVSPEEKKLREARTAVRWMPWLLVLALVLVVGQGTVLTRHPSVERLLGLMLPVGVGLCSLGRWREARRVLTGARASWERPLLLLGLLLMGSGPTLRDMYHRGDRALFLGLGGIVLALGAVGVGLLALEVVGDWRAARRARAQAVGRAEPPWYAKG